MKPILIIKTGSTLPNLIAAKGDFEDWIIRGSGLPAAQFQIVNVESGLSLPDFAACRGVLITGSHAMVTDRLDWSEKTAAWLVDAFKQGLPILGICYGHQLLAHALGGQVDYNPRGPEYGLVDIHLTPAAASDPLLSLLPPAPQLFVSHSQTVTQLPPAAVHLASSAKDANQAFRLGSRVWGVQFHPEFDAEITRTYIQDSHSELLHSGQDPQQLAATCRDNPLGSRILARFVELI